MTTYDLAKEEQARIMEQATLNAYAVLAVLGRKEELLVFNYELPSLFEEV